MPQILRHFTNIFFVFKTEVFRRPVESERVWLYLVESSISACDWLRRLRCGRVPITSCLVLSRLFSRRRRRRASFRVTRFDFLKMSLALLRLIATSFTDVAVARRPAASISTLHCVASLLWTDKNLWSKISCRLPWRRRWCLFREQASMTRSTLRHVTRGQASLRAVQSEEKEQKIERNYFLFTSWRTSVNTLSPWTDSGQKPAGVA